jgi:hypothetical protein
MQTLPVSNDPLRSYIRISLFLISLYYHSIALSLSAEDIISWNYMRKNINKSWILQQDVSSWNTTRFSLYFTVWMWEWVLNTSFTHTLFCETQTKRSVEVYKGKNWTYSPPPPPSHHRPCQIDRQNQSLLQN